jgi:hypothetical protein
MSTTYQLNVTNQSSQTGSFCLFQELPETNVPGMVTLAWLAKPAHPTTLVTFNWSHDYCFVWHKTQNLNPGTVVESGQSWQADLENLNQVNFDYSDEAYTFSDVRQGDQAGNLYIDQTSHVLPNDASVGIGMSGNGTFAVPSQPNMKIIITPGAHRYWLAFGNYQVGQIISVEQVKSQAMQLDFAGKTTLDVELTSNDDWRVL